jgi:hypothetical protein
VGGVVVLKVPRDNLHHLKSTPSRKDRDASRGSLSNELLRGLYEFWDARGYLGLGWGSGGRYGPLLRLYRFFREGFFFIWPFWLSAMASSSICLTLS